MSLSLLLLGNQSVERIIGLAQVAEASGYDAVWLADERFYREVYSMLTMLATKTRRVKLGPCVTDPYARHPALTAMAIGTLDEISGGRALLGIGAGISGFAELGIDRRKPPRAMRETIELVRRLLSGETVTYDGEIIRFTEGRLSFKPIRADIPVYLASNGPLGQRLGGAVADAVIMEACASVPEVKAFRAEVDRASAAAGRSDRARIVLRLNCCIAPDSRAAYDALRPFVARQLGAGRTKFRTLEEQGLTLPQEAVEAIGKPHYAEGFKPYLPLLPLVTDRHVDALVLAGTVDEVASHVRALLDAGADEIMIMPFAPEGGTLEKTVSTFGEAVWPAVRPGGTA